MGYEVMRSVRHFDWRGGLGRLYAGLTKGGLVQPTLTDCGGRILEVVVVKVQQIQAEEGDRPSLVEMGFQEEEIRVHQEGNRVVGEAGEGIHRGPYWGEP